LEEEEEKTLNPNFWNNPAEAEAVIKNIKSRKSWLKKFDALIVAFSEVEIAFEMFEDGDASEVEVEKSHKTLIQQLEDLEFLRMLGKEEDELSAIVQINSGAGGTESQDWAEMLKRMYVRWAEKNDVDVRVLDEQIADTAGIKSVSLEFDGDYVFGKLKGENGVHRLVRLSPFDSAHKRHTSFASVYVYPIVDDNIKIEIDPADLSWDTFRSSGPGGQHVNKTESAVRLRHQPSGIVIECQETRSQLKNREKAKKMLKSQLYEIELRKKQEAIQEVESGKKKIEWGSQIRSYVLHPYKLVKDNRTSTETSQINDVLDGDLDMFIKSFLLEFA
jgi:peptide chain release factor 2